jgi:transposase-like protein
VLIGATPEGRKELVGLQVGVRESAQSWRELLVDVKRRGLSVAPQVAVGDGALGFWRALDEIFPGTTHQWCWVHNGLALQKWRALFLKEEGSDGRPEADLYP